jgi:rhomboid protease GluP
MSTCANCGRPLPRFAFGRAAELCKDCLAREATPPMMQSGNVGQGSAPAQFRARRQVSYSDFPVTSFLLGANVLVYIAMVVTGVSPVEPSTAALLKWGADFGPYTLGGQPWRILSSAFVHGGIIHIGFNMWCFWDLGRTSERVFGKWPYLLIYLFTGVSASLLSLLHNPVEVSVGASGAIFGICGALIPALYFGRLPVPKPAVRATLRSLIFFAVFNLFLGASIAHIDNYAHVGGLVFGLLAGLLLSRTLIWQSEAKRNVQSAIFVALAVLLFFAWRFVERRNGFVVPLYAGSEAADRNNFKTATTDYARAIAMRPDIAELHFILADTYRKQQQPDKAVPELQKSLELNPHQPLAQSELCDAQIQLKQYADAVTSCGSAFRDTSNNLAAAVNESAALIQLGRFPEAIQLLEPLAPRAPNVAQVHMNLARAYFESGRFSDAMSQYQQVLKADPQNQDAAKGLQQSLAQLSIQRHANR